MQIRDLMLRYKDFEIITGESGLDREITTVTVMDAPDIYEWMRGGELLITSGYPIKSDYKNFTNLIERLYEKNVAGLAIKINRFGIEIPNDIREFSNRYGFPIIFIPDKYSFSDIINPVLTEIVNIQAKELEDSEQIQCEFMQLGIVETKIEEILSLLQDKLDRHVSYLDLENMQIFTVGSNMFIPEIKSYNDIDKLLEIYHYFDVIFNGRLYGRILVDEKDKTINRMQHRIINHANTLISLYTQGKIAYSQVGEKYKFNLLTDLYTGNIKSLSELNHRAIQYGWEMLSPINVVIYDIDDLKLTLSKEKNIKEIESKIEILYNYLSAKFKELIPDSYFIKRTDSIIFLVENQESSSQILKDTIESTHSEITDIFDFDITVGVGELTTNVLDTPYSYNKAKIAVETGRSIWGNNHIHYYNEIEIYHLMTESLKNDYGNLTNVMKIKNLIKMDKENDTDYFKSLVSLIKNDYNIKKTSEELFIHYNTMKNRYAKLSNILDVDFNNREEKFELELYLKLYNLKNIIGNNKLK